MLKRIKPEQATLGMYVQAFEGSWLSHPFWRTRFVIESENDLRRVRDGSADLVIDVTKGANIVLPREAPAENAVLPVGRASRRLCDTARPPAARAGPVPRPNRIVPPRAFGKADKARAVALMQRSTRVVKDLFEDSRLGRAVPTPQILDVVRDIADTLEQNSAAFTSVTRLKAKDDSTYTHSIAVCALMISLARETGASFSAVQDFGIAGLLHDIGKLSISDDILQKSGDLTDAEMAEVRRHPELGHAVLSAEADLPAVALDVCLHHHERLDGSGYPFGLRDESIGMAARMAAICDVYDAMTSHRPYKQGMSPTSAIAEMEADAGRFDSLLLFKFMRSVGIFPAGKLVRLRSNRLGIVLPTFQEDRRPVVRAFYSTIGSHFIDYEDAVLDDGLNNDQAVSAEDPAVWFANDWSAMSAQIVSGKPLPLRKP